jgi:hypothetical protein
MTQARQEYADDAIVFASDAPSSLQQRCDHQFFPMSKLVFDIETSALPLDRFDEAQQEYLFRECRERAL